jgi:exodeoxyribonuclease VII large subunit
LHDILNILEGRYPLVEVVLAATRVQGETAAAEIATAIERLDREAGCDVIIVARGGGSLEDLWAFNVETVARAIYASRTPVVSAIGHETDYTIADQVADVRAPTPSAAAELVVPDQDVLRRRLAELADQSRRGIAYFLEGNRDKLTDLVRRMELGLPNLETWRRRVDDLGRVVHSGTNGRLRLTRSQVDGLEQRVRALDPMATLSRGFSVVENLSSGQLVTNTSQVSAGDSLAITVADGLIPATAGRTGKNGRKKSKSDTEPQLMERLF